MVGGVKRSSQRGYGWVWGGEWQRYGEGGKPEVWGDKEEVWMGMRLCDVPETVWYLLPLGSGIMWDNCRATNLI